MEKYDFSGKTRRFLLTLLVIWVIFAFISWNPVWFIASVLGRFIALLSVGISALFIYDK
jgi:hypothetical protein